jgi:glycosyltransferase involved in cell wall biosynthesis
MSKVTIIIPARGHAELPFLSNTVDSLFDNAAGDIEVIVVLDAYWPAPPLTDRKNQVIIHRGTVGGMRKSINTGAAIATGDYLMKLDCHCAVGPGFDEILAADCEDNWLAVPSRYSLDPETWQPTRGPVDYLYLTFPYNCDDMFGTGFHGKKWKGPGGFTGEFFYMENERKEFLIDDILTFQGSSWFMPKKLFFTIGGLDEKNYNFHQEAQELGFKTWLSGGRCVRNKKTWYAHLHKGSRFQRGFRMSKRLMIESEIFSTDYWMNNRWPQQTRKLDWLIENFYWWPLEGWPEDWQDPRYAADFIHPSIAKRKAASQ